MCVVHTEIIPPGLGSYTEKAHSPSLPFSKWRRWGIQHCDWVACPTKISQKNHNSSIQVINWWWTFYVTQWWPSISFSAYFLTVKGKHVRLWYHQAMCVCMCVRARVSHFKCSTIQAMFTKFSADVTEIGNDSTVEARTWNVQKLQAIPGPYRRSVIHPSKNVQSW